MSDPRKTKEELTSFTVDNERSGVHTMPGVTKLLNRKTLSKTGTLSDIPQPSQGPPASPPPFRTPVQTEAPVLETAFAAAPTFELQPALEVPQTESPALSLTPVELAPGEIRLEEPHQTAAAASSPTSLSLVAPEEGISLEPAAEPIAEQAAEAQPTLMTQATSTTPIHVPSLKVQRAQRRVTPDDIKPLTAWTVAQLTSGTDPMGKVLASLTSSNAVHQALFLAIGPAPEGSPVPVFNASAGLQAQAKEAIWTGMCWDPRVVPEMWNYFVKTGFVEVSPPGTLTNQNSNRNVIRAAFGIQQDEWMTLVRIGPADGCRGVLALVTKKSINAELIAVLPKLAAAVTKKAA